MLLLYWNYLLSCVGTSHCSFGIFTIITKKNSQTLHSETKTQAEFRISVTGAEMTSLQPKEKVSTTK